MTDAIGIVQFMTAVAEKTLGTSNLSVQPVWSRELHAIGIFARDPPRVSCTHHEYDAKNTFVYDMSQLVVRSS